MKLVEFKQMNSTPAKITNGYAPAASYVNQHQGTVTYCAELSKEEKEQVQETGKIYFTILNKGEEVQPIGNSFINPFKRKK